MHVGIDGCVTGMNTGGEVVQIYHLYIYEKSIHVGCHLHEYTPPSYK